MKENPLTNNLPLGDETSQPQEKYLPLKNLVRHYPYWSAIILAIYAVIVLQSIRFIALLLGFSLYTLVSTESLIAEALLALLWVFVPLYVLNWWHTPGFQTMLTWPLQIRHHKALLLGLFFLLCLLPLFLLAFSPEIHQTPLAIIVIVAVLCLLVGIAEEGLFRGLILNMLLPKGIWQAVSLSSLVFGCMHILNVFVGFPLNSALMEMFFALGFGMFLAAVRLRTNSLRPGIIAHGLWDLPLLIIYVHSRHIASPSLLLALLVGSIIFAIYAVCTLIVLRPKKLRELSARLRMQDPRLQPSKDIG